MAVTVAGRRLTEQQRKSQVTLRSLLTRELVKLWPILNPDLLDQTAPTWLGLVLELVNRYRGESAAKAADYYRAFRAAETGQLIAPDLRLASSVDVNRANTSLIVTGPVRIKQLTASGADPVEAAKKTMPGAMATASRLVLDGGRDTIADAIDTDELALGYARVTDADPCAFCAMLAARGPVYGSATTATRTTSGQAYHDGCACTAEPVFDRDTAWPGRAHEFEELWIAATTGKSGAEARRAFRRAYEGR